MKYYKAIQTENLPSILRSGLRPGGYVWGTLKSARAFLQEELEEEDLPEVRYGFGIVELSYLGKSSKDPWPDYPGDPTMEARVLEDGVAPSRIKLVERFVPR